MIPAYTSSLQQREKENNASFLTKKTSNRGKSNPTTADSLNSKIEKAKLSGLPDDNVKLPKVELPCISSTTRLKTGNGITYSRKARCPPQRYKINNLIRAFNRHKPYQKLRKAGRHLRQKFKRERPKVIITENCNNWPVQPRTGIGLSIIFTVNGAKEKRLRYVNK